MAEVKAQPIPYPDARWKRTSSSKRVARRPAALHAQVGKPSCPGALLGALSKANCNCRFPGRPTSPINVWQPTKERKAAGSHGENEKTGAQWSAKAWVISVGSSMAMSFTKTAFNVARGWERAHFCMRRAVAASIIDKKAYDWPGSAHSSGGSAPAWSSRRPKGSQSMPSQKWSLLPACAG